MPVTLRNTDILFNDGTTQNTAPSTPISTFTGTGTVGDIMIGLCTSTSFTSPGGTVSGSFLFRITSYSNNTFGAQAFSSTLLGGDYRNRTTAFSANPNNFTPQSGTWRLLSAIGAGYTADSYGSSTRLPMTIAIRIA